VRRLFLIATAAGTLAVCSTARSAVTPSDLTASAATVALFASHHTVVAMTTSATAPIATASSTPIAMGSATATTVATVTTAATAPTTLATAPTAGVTPSATPLTAGLAPPTATATKTAAAQPTATPTIPPSSTPTSVVSIASTPTVTVSPPLLSPTQTTAVASATSVTTSITTTMATATATTATTATTSAAAIIDTAKQYLGYPYANIGDEPSTGFSCIGLIHYVFARHGLYVPGNLETAYASAPRIDQSNLQPGDIVFFQNTVWRGMSHAALYVGNGRMIAADSLQTGVRWDMLSDPYWQAHYLGATRPLSNPSGTLLYPVPTPAADDPFATPTPDSGPTIVIEAGTRLSPRRTATLYSGPGANYDSIDTVPSGMSLTVVQTQGSWVNVSYAEGNAFGWVRGTDLALPSSSGHVSHVYSAHSAQHGHSSRNTRRHSASTQPVHSHGHGHTAGATRRTARTAGLGRHRPASASHATRHRPASASHVTRHRPASASHVTRHRPASASHVTRHSRSTTTSTRHRASPRRPTHQTSHTSTRHGSSTSHASTRHGSSTSHASTHRGSGASHVRRHIQTRHTGHGSTARPSHHGSTTHAATSKRRHVAQHVARPHSTSGYRLLTVTANVLFVRSAPSMHARILRRVFAGDHLRLLATHDGWDDVALRSGARGWVSAQWVR